MTFNEVSGDVNGNNGGNYVPPHRSGGNVMSTDNFSNNNRGWNNFDRRGGGNGFPRKDFGGNNRNNRDDNYRPGVGGNGRNYRNDFPGRNRGGGGYNNATSWGPNKGYDGQQNMFNQPPPSYGNRVGGGYGNMGYGSNRGFGGGGGRYSSSRGGSYAGHGNSYRTDNFDLATMTPENIALENELYGPPEKRKQSTGINFDKYDDIPVEVTGPHKVEPIENFSVLCDIEVIKLALDKCGYQRPTPVQKYAIPAVLAKRDLMACAQTGSGKTAAFMLPVIHSLLTEAKSGELQSERQQAMQNGRNSIQYPMALILGPTRELVTQIFDEVRKFSYRSALRPCVLYGGASIQDQLRDLSYGCHILVATPGRLIDVLNRETYLSFAMCKFLVLDEADRMLDMGFEPQIRQILGNPTMRINEKRQNSMFSATFPQEIQILAGDFLKTYVFLTVGKVGSTSENITQRVIHVKEEEKESMLLDLLALPNAQEKLTLVFVETKVKVDRLDNSLFKNKFKVVSMHGDRTQRDREKAIELFRTGVNPILIATQVAARGLDIPNVTHVINYDMTNDMDEYVHRIGRTGRMGFSGLATTFFNHNNKGISNDLMQLLKDTNQEVPDWLVQMANDARTYRSANGRYGSNRYGGGGGSRFGSRDHRLGGGGGGGGNNNRQFSSNKFGGSGGGGGPRGFRDYAPPGVNDGYGNAYSMSNNLMGNWGNDFGANNNTNQPPPNDWWN